MDHSEIPLTDIENEVHERRRKLMKSSGVPMPFLTQEKPISSFSPFEGNIEKLIGFTQVPTGIAGPLKIKGNYANGDFMIPLATTEGALVASYNRGMKAVSEAGGVTVLCVAEAVQRSPLFRFSNLAEVESFIAWMEKCRPHFQEIVDGQSRYAKLKSVKTNIEGNQLILTFSYHTGEAAGQNMVTLSTEAICQFLLKDSPVKPDCWFIEGNYSGDKKATALSFTNVRGKKVTAEIEIPAAIVHAILKTTSEAMARYWQSSTIGVVQTGAIGAQGHFANGLTALFLACGQDVACVAEAATGITRMEVVNKDDLYIAVTLPNLIVGTIGGGTGLPTQQECLNLLSCSGEGSSKKFAEICCAVVLAGELSIAAALSAGHFAEAHRRLGRKQ